MKWLNDAVFYEIYPQSFLDTNGDGIGDIPGIIARLDYISGTGFNAIWLNPWFESPFRDAEYDISDFYSVAKRYGTNEDARRLFAEAHKRGIHVILDLVICHTAPEHPWFTASCRLERNERSDLFIWSPMLSYRGDRTEPDDYYISGWSPKGSYKASFFAVQPAVNYGFGKVRHPWEMPYSHPQCRKNRALMLEVMRFWLRMGCDGFRVDMAGSVVKRDPEQKYTQKFWRETRKEIEAEFPEAVLVSEWFNPARSIPAGFHVDFYGSSSFRNDNWMTHENKGKIPFTDHYAGGLGKWIQDLEKTRAAIGKKGFPGLFSGNHDVWRMRHYSSLQAMAVNMALLLTLPGCPFIYYGDEIGMKYLPGVSAEGSDSRGGSRTPMQWNRTGNLGFSTADPQKLYLPVDSSDDAPTVEEALAGKNPLYTAIKQLLALRKAHKALQAQGEFRIEHGRAGRFPLAYERSCGKERLWVVLNPTDRPAECVCKHDLKPLLVGGECRIHNGKALLAPASYGIYLLEGSSPKNKIRKE